jgi:putative NADH-flavin reductase
MHAWQIILLAWAVYAIALNFGLSRRTKPAAKTSSISRGWGNRARVLIVGATGGTGRELVKQALELGHKVTAFVRKPEKLKLEHPNLRIVQGNVLNYESVEAAVRDQNAVLSALGHKRFLWPTRILSRGTENIMRAMRVCQAPRFVCESSLGVCDAVGRLGVPPTLLFVPLLLPFYFWDRMRQEELIRKDIALDWVIVRPPILTNGPKLGKYRHGPKVGNYLIPKRISRADVADFMLQQVNDDTYLRQSPGISD